MIKINNSTKFFRTIIATNDKKLSEKNTQQVNQYFYLDLEDLKQNIFSKKLRNFIEKYQEDINLELDSFLNEENKIFHQMIINSIFLMHTHLFALPYQLKTENKKENIFNIITKKDVNDSLIKQALILAESANFAKQLELMPPNYLNPRKFCDIVTKQFEALKNKNIKIDVIDHQSLKKQGLNLLCAVGQASNEDNQVRLLSISYANNHNKKKIALVGKGVTFDTGGLSLKPASYMKGMQYDMSGAAIVASTVLALAKNNIDANVVALMPLAVNDIGSNSLKPHDVITAYNKKTVEITNTDAEGRLILADAITYAEKDLHADVILTTATLTGAVEICFGDTYTPFWMTDHSYWRMINDASYHAGEQVWLMPLNFEYDLNVCVSRVADMENSSEKRSAGSTMGATFLKMFVDQAKYIHSDIASTNEYKNNPIGIMVGTFYYFVKDFK